MSRVGPAVAWVTQTTPTTEKAVRPPVAVTITSTGFDVDPATPGDQNHIVVHSGQNATFTNADSSLHMVVHDPLKDVPPREEPLFGDMSNTQQMIGEGESLTVDVPDPAGTYNFYCPMHPFMEGAFEVKEDE
jgi:plastocyanin